MPNMFMCECASNITPEDPNADRLPLIVTDEVYEVNNRRYPELHIYHVLTEHIDELDVVLEKKEGYALVREMTSEEEEKVKASPVIEGSVIEEQEKEKEHDTGRTQTEA